jgi:hypothetical protein
MSRIFLRAISSQQTTWGKPVKITPQELFAPWKIFLRGIKG